MNLDALKGVGPKTLKLFDKMGVKKVEDLWDYYPYRFDILKRTEVSDLGKVEKVILDGIIETVPQLFFFSKKMNKMTFRFNTGNRLYNVTIFNRSFMKKNLTVNTIITVIGKYDDKYNTITASDIKLGKLSSTPSTEPIYHIVDGISNKQIREYMKESFIYLNKVVDYIPNYIKDKYELLDKKSSLENLHFPKDIDLLKKAIRTLKYEEAFLFMLKMSELKQNTKQEGLTRNISFSEIDKVIKKLPFTLTEDQTQCVKDIYQDLTSSKRMNRLLQGDVGSGKTIVSFLAMYMNYKSGYQSALMAPTEILAGQHYYNFKKLFDKENINVALLTGKTSSKEKKRIYEQLENGILDVVIGTHALITEAVIYYNLGLVITDEQHRFGVHQRSNLRNKGIMPDVLYMSATPIPRTYALTLYGDMDISSIKTRPSGRKEVITYLKKSSEIKEVLTLMYQQLKENHQVYVIAPLIEESDKIDLTNVNLLEEQMNKAFGKLFRIGVLHGKMPNEEKEKIMQEFKDNQIQILISTTVIEVGIDVGNATIMVIFDAFRFGLSQLHQLRGRVGRNELQSYCILISDKETERLDVLTKTMDGFKISEEDFKLRGSGDLFGTRQSGDTNFKILNVKNDYKILIYAKQDCKDFLSKAGDIVEYNNILESVKYINNLD